MNKLIWIASGVVGFSIVLMVVLTVNQNRTIDSNIQPTMTLIKTDKTSDTQEDKNVPLPHEKDVINNFFQLINEGKASDAVMMMSKSITNDDTTKQSYGVMFNSMRSVKVLSIEESMKNGWTNTSHQYQVTLDIKMDPNSANNPIPYFGFDNGDNIRWINLVLEDKLWKVDSLSTGP